ncbi:MAG: GIY-YIG nuclease family protein [Bacteroidota bacterium]
MYYSYVLLSLKNGLIYKGSTENLENRIIVHNSGKVNFTSKYLPWELVLFEEFETRSEALKREKWYKSGVGREWIKAQMDKSS